MRQREREAHFVQRRGALDERLAARLHLLHVRVAVDHERVREHGALGDVTDVVDERRHHDGRHQRGVARGAGEVELGTAQIREIFRSSKFGNIAGCIVRSGTITRNSKARVIREGIVIADGLAIESLRRFKDDASEVKAGFECGLSLKNFNDIKEGDQLEIYEVVEVARSL